MVDWLEDAASPFPPVNRALHNPNGLLAAGGELSPQRLLTAYRQGIFPWFNPGEPILWWSPNPRCVIHPNEIHISKSLRKTIRRSDYTVTLDKAFTKVMQACAEPRSYQQGTWISPRMIAAYTALHYQGTAHSVEVWEGENLVGGLYGLSIGSLFFGESMFSRQANASKIAFSFLCVQLHKWGFNLIDCQVHNEHLESLGAKLIGRDEFSALLAKHIDDPSVSEWSLSIDAEAVTNFSIGIR